MLVCHICRQSQKVEFTAVIFGPVNQRPFGKLIKLLGLKSVCNDKNQPLALLITHDIGGLPQGCLNGKFVRFIVIGDLRHTFALRAWYVVIIGMSYENAATET